MAGATRGCGASCTGGAACNLGGDGRCRHPPRDIDVSDPDAVDWQRIADVLVTMAEFERLARAGELPDEGRLVEIPLLTEKRQVY